MRFHLLGLILLAGTAAPALAQSSDRIERRVEKLERDLAAVQRRSSGTYIQPEIAPSTAQVSSGGIPASDATADLTARLDSLEAQLARLTGASEENANRTRQLEGALSDYRLSVDRRLQDLGPVAAQPARLEPAGASSNESSSTGQNVPAASEPASTGDPAEDAYLVGFRQWEAGQFAAAQKSLETMAKKYPRHRRASYALNLAGRAYLDAGQPATAAKILLSNYQADAKGERAADSLYFLGQALIALKKPTNACKVYDELQSVYGDGMRDWVKQRLPKARQDAKCL
ncbi:MAG: tetratricopeptide repeat protein [Sphingosinicella sp.]|nr:tetratricopeptide repeat protein [Sphingosinicella sp.]